MPFIDSTYFTGEINISQAANDTQLALAIPQYETEILIKLLGYELYSLLMDDLVSGKPVSERFIKLVDGDDFTINYNGEEIVSHWDGLRNAGKISFIAYYVYYNYVERSITPYYGTGISMAPQGKDWERVSAVNKLCSVWEKCRALYGGYDQPSAYNYLANSELFPEWRYTPMLQMNPLGI